MSLSRFFVAAFVVATVVYSATHSVVADDPTSTTPAAAAPAATPATTPAAATPATAASLPVVVGLDTDAAADAVSETFLTLTLAYFNQAYLGAGIFADTIAAEAYEKADSDELLTAQVDLALQVEEQIQALGKAPGHDRDDLEVIEGFKKLAQLNRIQWETLRDVLGGDESKSKIWEEVRDTMLKELDTYGEDETVVDGATPAAPTTGAPAAGPAVEAEPKGKSPASAAVKTPVIK
jgi:hypothetical protein